MRPHGSPAQLEQRRLKAVALSQEGLGSTEIARQLNTTPQSVCRWLAKYRLGGAAALAAIPPPGRPSKLTARQRQSLTKCLLKGARASGFPTDLWTCPRVAQVIEKRYGVHYHIDALPRVLASLGFSPPEARATRR
jgi:transposase